MQTTHLEIRDGQVQDAGSWLYVWRPYGAPGIVYVGATGLPPAVRSWLHLHHEDPSVARVGHRHPGALTEPLEVLEFRLPDALDRSAAKAELVRRLAARGDLGESYVGDAPEPGGPADDVRRAVDEVLDRLDDGGVGARPVTPAPRALHHVELWTRDLAAAGDGWHRLLTALGWNEGDSWTDGRSWAHPDGTYLVLEHSPDTRAEPHDRQRPGLNHLALTGPDRAGLDALRAAAASYGWRELFAERYPHAGGPAHTALYLENAEGFEVEVVARRQDTAG